jgi:hypothetical protein
MLKNKQKIDEELRALKDFGDRANQSYLKIRKFIKDDLNKIKKRNLFRLDLWFDSYENANSVRRGILMLKVLRKKLRETRKSITRLEKLKMKESNPWHQ